MRNKEVVDELARHQLSERGDSCMCGVTFYSIPAPYPETLYQQARHQTDEIAYLIERE